MNATSRSPFWYGLAACDLIDELVPQQDLHLCEARLGERCEVLDARGGGSYLAVLGFRHVLNDVVLEVMPSPPRVHSRVRITVPPSTSDIPPIIRKRYPASISCRKCSNRSAMAPGGEQPAERGDGCGRPRCFMHAVCVTFVLALHV